MIQDTASVKLAGFDKPTVWTKMAQIAVDTKGTNLGQGFPAWSPPDFYLENLQLSTKDAHHQYTRAFGSIPLVKAIAQYHKSRFPDLNPETNIITVNGGVEGLYCSIMSLVNDGDEVIFFDPSYDCYRAQIKLAGGKPIGLPLKPKQQNSKESIRERCKEKFVSGPEDDWEIDYEAFEKAITEKTKIFIFNTPHNPVGKVFSLEEVNKLVEILKKYPRIIVLEDNVYERMIFDDMFEKDLPKIALQEGMFDRSLSVYSAGKIFAATGVRSGWVIGPAKLIKSVRSIHQYSVFCAYNIIESTVEKSLAHISQPDNTYMKEYAEKLQHNRNILIEQLLKCKYDFDLWIPKGGYFVMADISKVQVDEKYMKDADGNPQTKDYAFVMQLAYEVGVIAVPCSPFYSKEDSALGEKYVRFAFCKQERMLLEAGQKML